MIRERVMSRIVEVGDCWEWIGAFIQKRPVIKVEGQVMTVRRALAIEDGRMINGCWVMCGCDNWRCVNPEHSVIRKRLAGLKHAGKQSHSGEQSLARQNINRHMRKLTDEQAQEIMLSIKSKRKLAEEYGVHPKVIYRIKNNLSYKDAVIANVWRGLM